VAAPFTVTLDLGIGECITTISEIRERERLRDREARADVLSHLSAELQVIHEIIVKLEDIFITLVVGFTDRDVLQSYDRLQDLVTATRKYLTERRLLPELEKSMGVVSDATTDEDLTNHIHPQMVEALNSLNWRLTQFRDQLGRAGLITGVGVMHLDTLRCLGEGYLASLDRGDPDVAARDSLFAVADEAIRTYDFQLSGRIRPLIGYVQLRSRTAML
jgi:hypothetical protein